MLFAACGTATDEEPQEESDARRSGTPDDTRSDTSHFLRPVFPAEGGYLVAGRVQRLVYALADAEGVITRDAPRELEFVIDSREDAAKPVRKLAALRADGVPRPYYAVEFIPQAAGTFDIYTEVDGERLVSAFAVSERADVRIPQPGDRLRPVETATTDDPMGVNPICTRKPPCPFHRHSLAAVLGKGHPVAFTLSTPAFCQTGICGPTLDLLVEVAPRFPTVTYVHSEVYSNAGEVDDLAEADLVPAVDAYGLTFEPSLFLLDGRGVLVKRLDFVWDESELAESLRQLTA